MAKKFVFDTNVIQGYGIVGVVTGFYVAATVLSELMTACNDAKELKAYQRVWDTAEEERILLAPTVQDWKDASRILFQLAQERKQQAGGKAPKRLPTAKQEIALDCLLAMTASREGIIVVTNDKDFWAIQRYRKKLKLSRYPFV